jgi:Co/Zn/Cd efflux system component
MQATLAAWQEPMSSARTTSLIRPSGLSRPATPRKTYGYRHAETIAAFLNALTVMALSVWIVWEALLRLTGKYQSPSAR